MKLAEKVLEFVKDNDFYNFVDSLDMSIEEVDEEMLILETFELLEQNPSGLLEYIKEIETNDEKRKDDLIYEISSYSVA